MELERKCRLVGVVGFGIKSLFAAFLVSVEVLILVAFGLWGVDVKENQAQHQLKSRALQQAQIELSEEVAFKRAHLSALQNDPAYAERIARSKMNYADPRDVIVIFPRPGVVGNGDAE